MMELEFRNADFCGWRKTGEPGARKRIKKVSTRGVHQSKYTTAVRGERITATPPMLIVFRTYLYRNIVFLPSLKYHSRINFSHVKDKMKGNF
jgi:hypothetical protein